MLVVPAMAGFDIFEKQFNDLVAELSRDFNPKGPAPKLNLAEAT